MNEIACDIRAKYNRIVKMKGSQYVIIYTIDDFLRSMGAVRKCFLFLDHIMTINIFVGALPDYNRYKDLCNGKILRYAPFICSSHKKDLYCYPMLSCEGRAWLNIYTYNRPSLVHNKKEEPNDEKVSTNILFAG